MPNWEDNLFFKGQNWAKKGKRNTPSDEPTVSSVHKRRYSWYTAQQVKRSWHRRMNRQSFLDAPDELQRKSSEDNSTGWSDGLRRTPSVYPTLSLNQDRDTPRRCLQHRMNQNLGQGEASVYPTVAWKLTETTWLRGLQHRMNRRTVGV
jgi:hypothetical protein